MLDYFLCVVVFFLNLIFILFSIYQCTRYFVAVIGDIIIGGKTISLNTYSLDYASECFNRECHITKKKEKNSLSAAHIWCSNG